MARQGPWFFREGLDPPEEVGGEERVLERMWFRFREQNFPHPCDPQVTRLTLLTRVPTPLAQTNSAIACNTICLDTYKRRY